MSHRPLVWLAGAGCFLAAALVILALRTSDHPVESTLALPQVQPTPSPTLPDFAVEPVSTLEGDAKWYDVPKRSLAQRRAWPGEMTAASDRLPQETYVRVRRLDSQSGPQQTVVVRITDDGVHDKNTLIDLDRPAAEALGMVKAGQVRVRVEVLALQHATADKPVEKRVDPAVARVSVLTDRPTASEKQEKDASQAKAADGRGP